jgi:hypothetical protein
MMMMAWLQCLDCCLVCDCRAVGVLVAVLLAVIARNAQTQTQ